MSDHATLFSDAGLAALFEVQASSDRFVYVGESGAEVVCDAIIGMETIEEVKDKSERAARRIRRVQIKTDSVNAPRENATARVDGVEYAITFIETSSDGFSLLTLARSPMIETARPNYRTPTQLQRRG
jgi:hypothetical protein